MLEGSIRRGIISFQGVTIEDFLSIMDERNRAIIGEMLSKSTIPAQSEIIDRDELCKRLSITPQTCIKMEKRGKIPSIKIGSAVRYDYHKVIHALEK